MVCTLFDQFNIREILFAFHDTSKYILLSRLPFLSLCTGRPSQYCVFQRSEDEVGCVERKDTEVA